MNARRNEPKRVAIYARVSTDGQTVENQLRELREVAARHNWNVVHEFTDSGISGSKGRESRPAFNELHKAITRKDIDLVAAWKADRLGRSLAGLIAFLEELRSKGVDLYLHQQGVDTSTPAGRAMFQMLGVFAEFELGTSKERQKVGIKRVREERAARRAKGEDVPDWGRSRIHPTKERRIRKMLVNGNGILKTAKAVNVGTSTVQRIKKELADEAQQRAVKR
ncbi:MAG: recombinase family protein [Bryobacteraceae bacterium]